MILFLPPKMLSWLTHKNNIPCNHWLQKDTKEICAIHLLTLLQTSRIALICSPLHPTQGIESNEKHIIYVFTQSTITQMKELQLCKAIPASRVQELQKGTFGASLCCNKVSVKTVVVVPNSGPLMDLI